jgi:hypothetical protein
MSTEGIAVQGQATAGIDEDDCNKVQDKGCERSALEQDAAWQGFGRGVMKENLHAALPRALGAT